MPEKKKAATPKSAGDEKIFDVTSPGKTVASANSKPMIVSNRSVVRDPMVTPIANQESQVNPEEESANDAGSTDAMPISKMRIEPLHTDLKAETGELVGGSPKAEDQSVIEKAPEASASENDASKDTDTIDDEPTDDELDDLNGGKKKPEDKAMAAEAAAAQKRLDEAESAIASKQYFVPINAVKKRRSTRVVVVGLLVVIAVAALFAMGPGSELLSGSSDDKDKTQSSEAPAKPQASKKESAKEEKQETPTSAVITYSTLMDITSVDQSISLKVPEEYTSTENSETTLMYGQRKPGSTVDSYSSVGIRIDTAPSRSAMQEAKSRTIADLKAKGKSYDNIERSLVGSGTSAELGEVTDYKSGVLVDVLPSKDKLGNEVQGKVLVLFGTTKAYTIIIGADSAVWSANQAIFEQMIDSIVLK